MDASTDEFHLVRGSKISSLASKVQELASDDVVFVGRARLLATAGSMPPITAILREIDNTVLDRKLSFQVGDVSFAVIAAGRRLQGFVELPEGTKDADKFLNQVLSEEDPDVMNAATNMIMQYRTAEAKVTVQSEPARRLGKGSDAGMSVNGLVRVWNVDMDAKSAPPVERFLAQSVEHLVSSLYVVNGQAVEMSDNAVLLQSVWENQVPAFLEKYKKTNPHPGAPALMCFEHPQDETGALALAISGEEIAIMSYKPETIGQLLEYWQSVTS